MCCNRNPGEVNSTVRRYDLYSTDEQAVVASYDTLADARAAQQPNQRIVAVRK